MGECQLIPTEQSSLRYKYRIVKKGGDKGFWEHLGSSKDMNDYREVQLPGNMAVILISENQKCAVHIGHRYCWLHTLQQRWT